MMEQNLASFLPPSLVDLVLWRNLPQTGAVVATFNLLFYLLLFGGFTVPQLMLSIVWVSLLARFMFINAVRVLAVFDKESYQHIPSSIAKKLSGNAYSADQFEPIAEWLRTSINRAFAFWGQVSSCKDTMFAIKVLVGLQVGITVTSFFSLASLICLGLMALFTIPKAFESNADQIEEKTKIFWNAAKVEMDKLMQSIPKASDHPDYPKDKAN